MAWRWVSWGGVVLSGLLLAAVVFVAWHDGHDPRLETIRQIVRDLDEHGLKCSGVSADLSPADRPIAVNAEGGCTVDGRQERIVVVAAADGLTRDRYLRWLFEQGGGGYFVLGDAWGSVATSSGSRGGYRRPSAAPSASLASLTEPAIRLTLAGEHGRRGAWQGRHDQAWTMRSVRRYRTCRCRPPPPTARKAGLKVVRFSSALPPPNCRHSSTFVRPIVAPIVYVRPSQLSLTPPRHLLQ